MCSCDGGLRDNVEGIAFDFGDSCFLLTVDSKRVLVTGGAGFIGSHLVDRLVDEGYRVRVLDNLSSGSLSNIRGHVDRGRVGFVEGDIRDEKTVVDCVRDVGAVVHLAALVSVPYSVAHPDEAFDVNVAGTVNLLVAASRARVGRFVFASSCAVYGDSKVLPIGEGVEAAPVSPYAESKAAAEKFAVGFCRQGVLDCVVLRFFNVYGPRQVMNDYSGVISRFVDAALNRRSLVVFGGGNATRDFVYVSDVVDAVMLSLSRRRAVCEVFNVGTGVATTVNDLAGTVLSLTRSRSRVDYAEPRVGDIMHSYADVSKARELLGFRARTVLREGLRVLVDQWPLD